MTLRAADGADQINQFSGMGRRPESPAQIPLASITSCQVETNYIRFYQRYFKRKAKST